MTKLSPILLLLTLTACASATPENMVSLEMGMTKSQVIEIMGKPISVSSINDREYLNYNLCIVGCMGPIPLRQFRSFYVRMLAGRVESFGEKGDFDSTKVPTTRIEIDKTVRGSDNSVKMEQDVFSELRKLKELLDAGIITFTEFEDRKKIVLAR